MAAMSDFTGYVASTLVLLTFMTKDMRLLRLVAIFSNLAFISYGALVWLPPVLGLHLLLLPLNVLRLREAIGNRPTSSPGAEALCRAAAALFAWLERSKAPLMSTTGMVATKHVAQTRPS
jgi:hypothetical protein